MLIRDTAPDLVVSAEYRHAVELAVDFLDEEVGAHWPHTIDLKTFSINSPCACVLGQTMAARVESEPLSYDCFGDKKQATSGYHWALAKYDVRGKYEEPNPDGPGPIDVIEATAGAYPFIAGIIHESDFWTAVIERLQDERAELADEPALD